MTPNAAVAVRARQREARPVTVHHVTRSSEEVWSEGRFAPQLKRAAARPPPAAALTPRSLTTMEV
jgi:hypothetical protein